MIDLQYMVSIEYRTIMDTEFDSIKHIPFLIIKSVEKDGYSEISLRLDENKFYNKDDILAFVEDFIDKLYLPNNCRYTVSYEALKVE